jgi:hypothetical protein
MRTYTTTNANVNSASFRLAQRPAPAALGARIAHTARALAELESAGLGFTRGAAELRQRLADAELEAVEAVAAEVARNAQEAR